VFSGSLGSNVSAPLFFFLPLLYVPFSTYIVLQSEQLYSDQQLTEGLLQADEDVLQHLYTQVRPVVQRAVSAVGGSSADGNAFFLAAVADMAQLLRQGKFPETTSFAEGLAQLAVAHFQSWGDNRKAATPSEAVPELPIPHFSDYESLTPKHGEPDTVAGDAENAATDLSWLPDSTALTETRKHIFAWKSMSKLHRGCTEIVLEQPDNDTACKKELAVILHSSGDKPAVEFSLPDWGETAIRRKDDYLVWTKLRAYDHNISRGLTIDGVERSSGSTVAKYLFLTLLAVTVGYMVYAWFNRPKPAGEIFKENFTPPESLIADINRRFENDTSGIVRPERCEELLREADKFYGEKNYQAAMDPLGVMLDNEDLPGCRSDALFAMAIVSLKRNEPSETLQYLAKIDNIEAYGEDLYWYQALAFVQLAKSSASLRPVARKAVDRFLENTKIEERRVQAQKMLEEL